MDNVCDRCGSNNFEVIDTRPSRSDFFSVRRRRRCMDCGYRFTTYEVKGAQVVAMAYELFRSYMYPQLLTASIESLETVFKKSDTAFRGIVEKNSGDIKSLMNADNVPEQLKTLAQALETEGII